MTSNKYNCDCKTMECDDIDWLVDVLGTDVIVKKIIGKLHVDLTDRKNARSTRGKSKMKEDGLYYDGAHWHCTKNGKTVDSYLMFHQIRGTAHFCQTFAMMYYIDEYKSLREEEWSYNIKVAMAFWANKILSDDSLSKTILSEIHDIAYERKDDNLPTADVCGKSLFTYKKSDLLHFLECVAAHSQNLVSCKQG